MKKILFALSLLAFAAIAQPAQPPAPKAPTTVATTSGTVCDTWGIVDGSAILDGVEYDAGYIYAFAPALPMADVNDNHKKWVKVLDAASKEQDKGGPYEAEVSEYRSCDGGGVVKISDGSILLKGMTLAGLTRITDEALKQGAEINKRTKARSKNQNSTNHDHKKAKKVKRNDLGQKVKD